jgi:hypothetical protein
MEMHKTEFQRFYKVAQSFAGQAVRHGIAMNGEKLQWPERLPPDDPELREATLMWLRLTSRHTECLELHRKLDWAWNSFCGQQAGWAMERGIKALLTALNDPVRFRHGITPMWQHLQRALEWDTPSRAELRQALEEVSSLTDCEDEEQPDARGNLLAQYIDDWRRDRIDRSYRRLDDQEQADLTKAVIEAATQLCEEARRLVGLPASTSSK